MRSATELRDEILAAARTEFARYGLAGARIDRIAKAASASKERLYAHFGDKETLFRHVVSRDAAEFFRTVSLRPDAVPEFVGDVYDLARNSPEHLRMITWARLEGLTIDDPDFEAHATRTLAALATAKADGYVDARWQPAQLLVLLFGIGMAWAHSPHPDADVPDPGVVASCRAAAVEAATRVVSPRC